MFSRLTPAGLALAAGLVAASLPAYADEPTQSALNVALAVIADVGLKASVDNEVPTLAGEIQQQLAQLHPEMQASCTSRSSPCCRSSRKPIRAC